MRSEFRALFFVPVQRPELLEQRTFETVNTGGLTPKAYMST